MQPSEGYTPVFITTAFSILNRIESNATIGIYNVKTEVNIFQYPQSDRIECNRSISHIFHAGFRHFVPQISFCTKTHLIFGMLLFQLHHVITKPPKFTRQALVTILDRRWHHLAFRNPPHLLHRPPRLGA